MIGTINDQNLAFKSYVKKLPVKYIVENPISLIENIQKEITLGQGKITASINHCAKGNNKSANLTILKKQKNGNDIFTTVSIDRKPNNHCPIVDTYDKETLKLHIQRYDGKIHGKNKFINMSIPWCRINTCEKLKKAVDNLITAIEKASTNCN